MYPRNRIGWGAQYQLGIQTIDQQHLLLFNLINELADSCHRGQPSRLSGRLIAQLVTSMANHFRHEEELLDLRRYPQADRHKAEHARYLTRMNELSQRFAQAPSSETLMRLHRLLTQWFVEHIEEEDRLFAPYLRALETD